MYVCVCVGVCVCALMCHSSTTACTPPFAVLPPAHHASHHTPSGWMDGWMDGWFLGRFVTVFLSGGGYFFSSNVNAMCASQQLSKAAPSIAVTLFSSYVLLEYYQCEFIGTSLRSLARSTDDEQVSQYAPACHVRVRYLFVPFRQRTSCRLAVMVEVCISSSSFFFSGPRHWLASYWESCEYFLVLRL